MSKRQNPEDFLTPELEDLILHGGVHTIPPWPDGRGWEYENAEYDYPVQSLGGPGSQNWHFDAMAARALVGFRARGYNPYSTALAYFTKSRMMWMGTELDSIIYAYMHGDAAIGCALCPNESVRHAAVWWLKHWAARCLLFYDAETNRVLTAGERSAGALAPGEKSWQDIFLASVMGWSKAPRHEKVLRYANSLLLAVGKELREGVPPQELLKTLGFQTLETVRVAEWPHGKGVWIPGQAINGNTQSVRAAVQVGGRTDYAPYRRGWMGPGDRTHRKKGRANLIEMSDSAGSRLLYESEVYPNTAIVIANPGERTLDVEIGGPEIVRDFLQLAPPPEDSSVEEEDDPTEPEPKSSWLSRMLRRIFG